MRLPAWIWLATAALVAWGATTTNSWITVFSIVLLPVLAFLLWRRSEPPVLLFACAMQWLQAATIIFYQDFYRLTLDQAYGGPELARATWLSLIGVIVVALGMRAALVGAGKLKWEGVERESKALSPVRLFWLYLIFLAVSTFVRSIAFSLPGITQPLIAATSLHWIPVILLIEAVLTQRRGYGLLALVVMLEFGIGLLGYFSSFKSVFLILFVLLLASPRRLPKGRLVALFGIVVFLLLASAAWTAMKPDYREFLNKGTGEQAVYEPVAARVEKLIELVGGLNAEKLEQGFEESMLRISYVTFFAHCMVQVPADVPYENGALWFGAVQHTFMPRLFFPNKATTDDSARTAKYTGIDVAGREQGASIGLGYMAESYIDFGPYFMFAPIFLLGVFYGLIYRLLAFRERYRLLGAACAIAILVFGAYNIETSNVKLIGGNTMSVLVLGLFYWRFGPAFFKFVSNPPSRATPKTRNAHRRATFLRKRVQRGGGSAGEGLSEEVAPPCRPDL